VSADDSEDLDAGGARPPSLPGLTDPRLVGRGAAGTVWRARQERFSRDVAVKVIEQAVDRVAAERFARECQAVGGLSGHPYVVTVLEAGVLADGRPFLTMPFLPGGSLADASAQRGPLPWEEVVDVGVKIASALHAAHAAGVLHRDIKPENLLVSAYGEPVLADFGIARLEQASLTRTGMMVATPMHAAPEVMAGRPASAASDVYGLGSSLYRLLAGRPAFWSETDESLLPLLARVASQPPPDLRPLGVPGPVASAVERSMAKDPAARPASALEFGRELQEAQRAAGAAVTRAPALGDSATSAGMALPSEPVRRVATSQEVPLPPLPPLPPPPPVTPTPSQPATAPIATTPSWGDPPRVPWPPAQPAQQPGPYAPYPPGPPVPPPRPRRRRGLLVGVAAAALLVLGGGTVAALSLTGGSRAAPAPGPSVSPTPSAKPTQSESASESPSPSDSPTESDTPTDSPSPTDTSSDGSAIDLAQEPATAKALLLKAADLPPGWRTDTFQQNPDRAATTATLADCVGVEDVEGDSTVVAGNAFAAGGMSTQQVTSEVELFGKTGSTSGARSAATLLTGVRSSAYPRCAAAELKPRLQKQISTGTIGDVKVNAAAPPEVPEGVEAVALAATVDVTVAGTTVTLRDQQTVLVRGRAVETIEFISTGGDAVADGVRAKAVQARAQALADAA